MRRITKSLLGTLLVLSAALAQGAVRAQNTMRVLAETGGNLEGAWHFRIDPGEIGEREGWQRPDYRETDWQSLQVPGYWEAQGITTPRPGQPPKRRQGMLWTDYDGVAWYRLRFRVPATWKGKNLLLILGSVDDEDRTFLNGQLVGEVGSGKPQAVTIQRQYRIPAKLVRPGAENVLAVRVRDNGGPGGLMGPLLSLLPEKALGGIGQVPGENRSLGSRFANPAGRNRILKIIHSWPDSPEAQAGLIRQLIAQGFGGVVSNVSFTDYLTSEARWTDFVRAIRSAKAAGMAMWLYDERGYPSGVAGGLTLRDHPEGEAFGLLSTEADSAGGPLTLALPPGRPILTTAYPVVNRALDLRHPHDLSAHIRDGKITAELPQGNWRVLAITESRLYEGTHAQMSLADKKPYINLLDAAPTARFLGLTHQQYAQRLGPDLHRWFEATFTDEPSLMSLFLRPMPYRVLPWSRTFAAEFRKRRGYALEPLLPALLAETGKDTGRVRVAFWQTVGELVAENYFGQIRAWDRQHRIASGGHLLMEESLASHVPLYGDFFRCARCLDAPGMDCLTSVPSEVPWSVARLLGSVADLEGRSLTMCETSDFAQTYRPPGDNRPVRHVTEAEIRGTCNRLLLGGIHTITSYYTFSGLSSEEIRRLNTWVGRCSTLLSGGYQVTDIAVLYPIESVWPHFLPSRNGVSEAPMAGQVESAFQAASDSLYAAGRDFTYIDSRTLREAKVESGALKHRGLQWRVIVLPRTDTLPRAAWENLARFWKQGGVVIALGALPANTEMDFPSAYARKLAQTLFGIGERERVQTNGMGGIGIWLPAGTESLLPMALDAALEREASVPERDSPLHVAHRRVNGQEVYFLINDSARPWKGSVRLTSRGAGTLWDPATGRIVPAPNGGRLALDLPPYSGMLARFSSAGLPARHRLSSGALPGLKIQGLPVVAPRMGAGEFVRASFAAEGSGWRASGLLTRGQVDTHQMLSFLYPKPIDLRGTLGLALDLRVPQGQAAGTNLLVIVRDQDGGEYLANTGQSLSLAGSFQLIVPWSRFQPAGWAHDPNGHLDIDRVAAITVGWGGYFGAKDERVEFQVAAPQAVRLP